eukprot:SAG22_NODE_246_length_13948_cov_12.055744_19_plen_44_part_00
MRSSSAITVAAGPTRGESEQNAVTLVYIRRRVFLDEWTDGMKL